MNAALPSPYFRVGESILASGVYRVYHNRHRVSHEVSLFAGETFPRCSKCGEDVHFELILCATERQQQRPGL